MILLQSFNRFHMSPVNGPNGAKSFLIATKKGTWSYYLDWSTYYIYWTQYGTHKLPDLLIHKTTKDKDGIF